MPHLDSRSPAPIPRLLSPLAGRAPAVGRGSLPCRVTAAAGASLLVLAAAGCGADSGGSDDGPIEYPTKTLQLMAPAAPGDGWDSTARSMQKVLTDA